MKRSSVPSIWFCGALALAVILPAGLRGAPRDAIEPHLTVMVPMRDGVRLATDVYLPESGGPSWPVRLTRTPYGRKGYAREYGSQAQRGYAMVVQDMRGRFDSQGKDLAFADCGWAGQQDGLTTLEWLHAQEWCNGKVGTEGASAMGITQYLLAPVAGDRVAAQYILVGAPSLYHHASYVGGAFRLSLTTGWLSDGRFAPENFWIVAAHPLYDPYWQDRDAIRRAPDVNAPAVHFGGWYDVFQQGTIDGFASRQERGGPKARGTQKLIIGPWAHAGPQDKPLGELRFPDNQRAIPVPLGASEWFDHHLKGLDTGVEKAPAVQYYTMGAIGEPGAAGNLWRTADAWPVPARATSFYLHADGTLARSRPDAAAVDAAVEYTFDPLNPVPTHGGCLLLLPPGIFDQRALEARPDVVTFTSAPLEQPLEVTGRLRAQIELITDRVDTDVAVKLTDVYPDGRSYNIADGLARARARAGFERISLLTPGEPATLEVDLWSTSYVFNRGHRIRVAVTGSNYPRFDVNPNTGRPHWPLDPLLSARHRILCSADRASRVILPVVD